MRIGDTSAYSALSSMAAPELEEMYGKRRSSSGTGEEEALEKVDEVKNSNTKAAFKMMDNHNEMVHKSQEENKKESEKLAVERLAQKRAEEHSDALADMAKRNAERRDLLEDGVLKGMYL